jgi:hypothetical protein
MVVLTSSLGCRALQCFRSSVMVAEQEELFLAGLARASLPATRPGGGALLRHGVHVLLHVSDLVHPLAAIMCLLVIIIVIMVSLFSMVVLVVVFVILLVIIVDVDVLVACFQFILRPRVGFH